MTAFDTHPRKIAAGAGLAGAAMALAVSLVGGFEGKRNYTYFDIAGVPTYCYGGTGPNAKPGASFTNAQCSVQLSTDLRSTWLELERCAPELGTEPATRQVAFLSLGYNIGAGAFCHSSIPGRLHAGSVSSACGVIREFNHAGGKVVAGLTLRRASEYNLCMKGIINSV